MCICFSLFTLIYYIIVNSPCIDAQCATLWHLFILGCRVKALLLICTCYCYLAGLGYTQHVQKREAVPRPWRYRHGRNVGQFWSCKVFATKKTSKSTLPPTSWLKTCKCWEVLPPGCCCGKCSAMSLQDGYVTYSPDALATALATNAELILNSAFLASAVSTWINAFNRPWSTTRNLRQRLKIFRSACLKRSPKMARLRFSWTSRPKDFWKSIRCGHMFQSTCRPLIWETFLSARRTTCCGSSSKLNWNYVTKRIWAQWRQC